jgi:hypothetical protein
MKATARRALFTVLILLTALRGMVGDAMAYGMTEQMMQTNATYSIALGAVSMQASGHFEHQKALSVPCHDAVSTQGIDDDGSSSESIAAPAKSAI